MVTFLQIINTGNNQESQSESYLINYSAAHLPHFCAPGNTFYLVMPTEQGESATEDPDDPPTPTASHFPQPLEEVASPQTQPDDDAPICGLKQTEDMQLEQEEETSRSQATHHSHVIKNVDEIFHTIEGLMSKLRELKVSGVRAVLWPSNAFLLNMQTAAANMFCRAITKLKPSPTKRCGSLFCSCIKSTFI